MVASVSPDDDTTATINGTNSWSNQDSVSHSQDQDLTEIGPCHSFFQEVDLDPSMDVDTTFGNGAREIAIGHDVVLPVLQNGEIGGLSDCSLP